MISFKEWLSLERIGKSCVPSVPSVPALAPLSDVISHPLHTRIAPELDDCDRAVHAAAHGLPMPAGWACITGDMIDKAREWEATADIRRGFQTRKSEERDKSAGMRAPVQLLRLPIAKPQAGTCPGCFQPIGEARTWEDGEVCQSCFEKAEASPYGFGLTLSRACRWNQTAAEAMA